MVRRVRVSFDLPATYASPRGEALTDGDDQVEQLATGEGKASSAGCEAGRARGGRGQSSRRCRSPAGSGAGGGGMVSGAGRRAGGEQPGQGRRRTMVPMRSRKTMKRIEKMQKPHISGRK